MKSIKSFNWMIFLAALAVCLGLVEQKRRNWNLRHSGHSDDVMDTDFGAFLAAQHALYVNDFDGASRLISDVKTENKSVNQIKNLTDFFSGKMPQDAKSFKDSKDLTERLIYDAFLIQQDDWKSVYKRYDKETSFFAAPIRIFSGIKTGNPKDTAKFIDSLKADENWKSFVRGQIAVLNNDIDGAAKEFAKVHPEFMNVNDYLYLMSFYKHNNMTEDMEILHNDFIQQLGSMHMVNRMDIPDWSNFEGFKNNLVFGLVQTVSHTQVMIYTDLSLMFLRFADIISDGTNRDAINYYLGQYYYHNSGDFASCFNAIPKSSPFHLYGQLKIAEKSNDIDAMVNMVRKNPLFIPAVQIIGRDSVKNGNKSRILSIIHRALRQKHIPNQGKLYFLKQRAYIYAMFGDAVRAQRDLDAVEDIDFTITPEIMGLQARVWVLQNKNLDKAYNYAMNLVRINPSNVSSWDLLSTVVEKTEGVTSALEILERVGEVTPSSSVYEHLGDFYKKQGDLEQARKSYKRAIELSDDYFIIVPAVEKKIRKLK